MQNILKNLNKKYDYFKKNYKYFPDDRFYSLDDYCDIYLKYFGKRYRTYLYPFCELLKSRGIYFRNDCYVEELLWNKLKYGEYKDFKSKRERDLNVMTGIQFEIFLAKFFTHCGYIVDKTPFTNDKGADLILRKGFSICVVQAKRHNKTIAAKEVRDVYAAKTIYQADKAMVITNSKFSRQARDTADKLYVELWDGEQLKNELNKYNYF
jgi:hypothetical protein